MQIRIKPFLRLTAFFMLLAGCSLNGDRTDAKPYLEQNFRQPPLSARPWVYLFCDNGNLTKTGITADLEAMKRVGIGGVLFFEIDHGAPKGAVEFASQPWCDMIKHLCSEAARLGLQVNMNNAAGWAGSAGPWITPELSMQKLTTSETFVEGGKRFEGVLTCPPAEKNFYRDIAVLAFPTPAGDDVKMCDQSPKLTGSFPHPNIDLQQLVDGSPATKVELPLPTPGQPVWLQVEFPQPFMARTLIISTLAGHDWWMLYARGEVQVSDDGQKFRTVCNFTASPPSPTPGAATWLQMQLNQEGITARWFRIVFTAYIPNSLANVTKLPLARVELTSALRIEDIAGKAGISAKYHGPPLRATFPKLPAEVPIPRGKVIDITTKMSADGKLAWDVPPGKWTILRIGHTTTGKEPYPAPQAGIGLECDKLSKAGIEAHFAGFLAKLVADNQPLVGGTLVSTHSDSWESGSQNWTPKFREEFQRLRGYDLLPLLPVVTGRCVDSSEVTERFLWDFRQTISDLLVENYAGHLRTLAHQHGLQLSIEAYGSPADDLTYAGQADEPMGEFWSWTKFGIGETCAKMTSAAHVYGRKIIGAEAFTGSAEEKWQSYPGNIKDLGDWAFCEGINRFAFHRYSLQPWGDPAPAPGLSVGPYGLHYERTQTWWEQSRAWHEYIARCQFMLRQGLFVADLCILSPEGQQGELALPTGVRPGPLDRGPYNFDSCPTEVVLTRMSVKAGRIMLPDGMSYSVLMLPEVETMTPALLRKIKELADAGATVLGGAKPPQKSPSLNDYPNCDAEVKQLADELWSSGKIVSVMTAGELLAKRGVKPDFAADKHLRYIHRRDGETDFYFVANPDPCEVESLCSFRVTGKQPELWWPDTGHMENATAFEQQDGVTRVPLRFDPSGSVFVVFRKEVGRQKLEARTKNWLEFKPAKEIAGPWEVRFDPKWGGPAKSVTFENLEDWSKRAEDGVRYYSGTAIYRKQFKVDDSMFRTPRSALFLDLGKVAVMAEVKLNGQDLGIVWKPPFRVDITDAVKAGDNTLEVKVVNLWINRMIGDEQLPQDCERQSSTDMLKLWPQWLLDGRPSPTGRYTFASWSPWKKDSPLLPSGLLGPVQLMASIP